MSNSPRVLIIGGHVRSGTTMLGELVNSHPDIVVTRELRAFARLNRGLLVHLRGVKYQAKVIPSPSGDGHGRSRTRLAWFFARYAALLSMHPWNVRYDDVVRALHWCHPRAAVIGDQAAQNHRHLRSLVRHPNARVVIVYRDCRDVVSSVRERTRGPWARKEWTGKWAGSAVARRWVEHMDQLDGTGDRVLKIRYETFVADPRPDVEHLAAFLGVDSDGFRTDFIRQDSVGKHRSGLTDEEMATVMEIAGPTLRRLGYIE